MLQSQVPTGLPAVQELEDGVEASRVSVRSLANHRAALASEAAAGESQAAVARRRLPQLEADKKTAAAARVYPLQSLPASNKKSLCSCLADESITVAAHCSSPFLHQ